MKKLLFILFIASGSMVAQLNSDGFYTGKFSDGDYYENKWSGELHINSTVPVNSFSDKYKADNHNSIFSNFDVTGFSVAGRYMFNPYIGFRTTVHSENLKKSSATLPWHMQFYGAKFELVTNGSRLLNVDQYLGNFGFLVHTGLQFDYVKSKTPNTLSSFQNYNARERTIGLIYGITPQYKISKKLALQLDISGQFIFLQHFNWDGSYNTHSRLHGLSYTTSIGLSYSFGSYDSHGDWYR